MFSRRPGAAVSHSPLAIGLRGFGEIGTEPVDETRCLAAIHLRGTYTLGHGTGRYGGISGHGAYKTSILAIGQKVHGTCSQSRPPVASQLIINASGPVSLPSPDCPPRPRTAVPAGCPRRSHGCPFPADPGTADSGPVTVSSGLQRGHHAGASAAARFSTRPVHS
jgi:hypothetical protein